MVSLVTVAATGGKSKARDQGTIEGETRMYGKDPKHLNDVESLAGMNIDWRYQSLKVATQEKLKKAKQEAIKNANAANNLTQIEHK